MTVPNTKITSGPYVGTGLIDTYAYDFGITEKTEIEVFETTDLGVKTKLTVDVDFNVTGLGDDTGGTVVRSAGNLPVDYQWFMRSKIKETQNTAFNSQGGFFPDVHEKAIDKNTRLIQQLKNGIERSLRWPDSDSGTETELPDVSEMKGKVLGFDGANGSPVGINNPVSVGSLNGVTAGTYAELRLIATGSVTDGTPVTVSSRTTLGDKGGGFFRWDSSNLSVEVSADTESGLYVAPSSDLTGASGAWVRQFDGAIVVDWFGTNTAAFLAALAITPGGGRVETASVLYNLSTEVNYSFTSSQDRITVYFPADFIFSSTNGFIFDDMTQGNITTGSVSHFKLETDDGVASAGVGVEIRNTWSSEIDIARTSNFMTGTKLVGGNLATSGNGMAFSYIKVRRAEAPILAGGTSVLVTTEPFGATPGYFNENKLDIGFIRSYTGIDFVKGSLQTDSFNGNKLLYPQFENVADTGMRLEYCRSNTILYPRFEGGSVPASLWIDELSDCARNDYYITGPVNFVDLFSLNGVLHNVFGSMNNSGGSISANLLFGGSDNASADPDNHDLFFARTVVSDTPNGSVYWGGIPGDNRWERYAGGVRDDTGTDRVFGLLDPVGEFNPGNVAGLQIVPRGVSFISLSTASTGDVTLRMNADREIDGYYYLLDIPFFTHDIEITKDNGFVNIAKGVITSAGLYMVVLRGGSWKVSRIGDKLL